MYTCNADQWEYLVQERHTHDLVIGSVDFRGLRSTKFAMRYTIDPQNQLLLERPRGHVFGELSISRFLAAERGVRNGKCISHRPSPKRVLLGEVITEQFDTTDPGCSGATTSLETSNKAQGATSPKTLATSVCSLQDRISTRICGGVRSEALGGGTENGEEKWIAAQRGWDTGEPNWW